ncbi:hypothetical protein [uncultured Microscilla sp.]|uniref:hypothetical protein n=1 Tax=uncultured Microscilla sp. TaxID=432653 RepID=UPI0026326178|nr:hypothetical protein [uncultured Microscilla sp.]
MDTTQNNQEVFIDSPYLKSTWDQENSIVNLQWLTETKYIQENELKKLLTQAAVFVKEKRAKRWLADTKEFDFVMEPDLQDWISGEFNQILAEAGLEKMAVIIPPSYFAEVALQQTTNDMVKKQSGTMQVLYFDRNEKALEWLKE